MRFLTVYNPNMSEKPISIKCTFSEGAWHSLSKYFQTKNIQHIKGSLFLEDKAYFMIDGQECLVTSREK